MPLSFFFFAKFVGRIGHEMPRERNILVTRRWVQLDKKKMEMHIPMGDAPACGSIAREVHVRDVGGGSMKTFVLFAHDEPVIAVREVPSFTSRMSHEKIRRYPNPRRR